MERIENHTIIEILTVLIVHWTMKIFFKTKSFLYLCLRSFKYKIFYKKYATFWFTGAKINHFVWNKILFIVQWTFRSVSTSIIVLGTEHILLFKNFEVWSYLNQIVQLCMNQKLYFDNLLFFNLLVFGFVVSSF